MHAPSHARGQKHTNMHYILKSNAVRQPPTLANVEDRCGHRRKSEPQHACTRTAPDPNGKQVEDELALLCLALVRARALAAALATLLPLLRNADGKGAHAEAALLVNFLLRALVAARSDGSDGVADGGTDGNAQRRLCGLVRWVVDEYAPSVPHGPCHAMVVMRGSVAACSCMHTQACTHACTHKDIRVRGTHAQACARMQHPPRTLPQGCGAQVRGSVGGGGEGGG